MAKTRQFVATFDIENAAFDPDPRDEVARTLEDVATAVRNSAWQTGVIKDCNGNRIGTWTLDERDEEVG